MTADSFPERPSDKPYAQEGYALMAAAFEVHRVIGGGLLEAVYQEALEQELTLRNIGFTAHQELAIFYKGTELRHRYIPDLFVHPEILVELKAVGQLIPEHEAQLLNYLRLAKKPVGYLINFAPLDKVEWKRFVISKHLPPQPSASISDH
ncbi:MAG: GxxExxY protein [Verrucomicrobiaceae bacterium]|nr:GxxExxY protein [Verrucomicrobiaceae bacterium]